MFRRLNKDLQSHLTNLPAATQLEITASHYKYLFQPLFSLQEIPFDSVLPHYLWFVKPNLTRVSGSSNLNNRRLLVQNYSSNRIFPSSKNLFDVRKVSAGSTLFYQNPTSRSRSMPNRNPSTCFHFTPIWSTHYLYSLTTLRLLGCLPAPMRGRDITENLFFEHGLLSKSFRSSRRS